MLWLVNLLLGVGASRSLLSFIYQISCGFADSQGAKSSQQHLSSDLNIPDIVQVGGHSSSQVKVSSNFDVPVIV